MKKYLNSESLTGLSNVVMGGAVATATFLSGAILPGGSAQLAFGVSGLIGSLGSQQQREVERILRRLRRRLDDNWDKWSGLAEVRDEGLRASILQSVDDVLPHISISREEVVELRLDAEALANLVIAKAAKAMPGVFDARSAPGQDEALAREVLWNLTWQTYSAMTQDAGYADLMSPQLWQSLLTQTDRIEAAQTTQTDRLARMEAMLRDALAAGGAAQSARDSGVSEEALIALASRIAGDVQNGRQALKELEAAVDLAISAQSRDAEGDSVLHQVAQASAAGDHASAGQTIDAELSRMEAEHTARKTELLTAALEQDLLRRDSAAAATRIEALTLLDPGAGFAELRKAAITWFSKARDEGTLLALDVADALADRLHAHARGVDQEVAALNLTGVLEHTRGERQGGIEHLLSAIATFEKVLDLISPQDAPDMWSRAQMNLANSTVALGMRDMGNDRLARAIDLYKEALAVRSRDTQPDDWARTQMNLAGALRNLAEDEGRSEPLETALSILEEAIRVRERGKDPVSWAVTVLNRALTNRVMAEQTEPPDRLEMALADLEEIEPEFRSAGADYYLAHCAMERGLCLMSRAHMPGADPGLLPRARISFGDAALRFGTDMSLTDEALARGFESVAACAASGDETDLRVFETGQAALIQIGHRKGAQQMQDRLSRLHAAQGQSKSRSRAT